MLIKVDEDLPVAVADTLRACGYCADTVSEENLRGVSDLHLWKTVQDEKRFLVTADKGFADIRSYPPGTHPGILLLRPDEDGVPAVVALLSRVTSSCNLERLTGALAVATPRGIRIRPAPRDMSGERS